jgi:proteasome lid subunit RPN8/RPN11
MTQSQPTSAVPAFEIDNEVTRRIRQHARASMTSEVCGVLIGQNPHGVVQVIAAIEAANAAQGGTHVTFTQDAWESIYRVKDEQYPEERIVGWYHSHPGFGVFLSEHDTFIHRNFFSSPDQVAWVYDPHTDEEGCFGWIDGDIHRIAHFCLVDNNGDGLERTPKEESALDAQQIPLQPAAEQHKSPAPWLRWVATALSCLLAMVLGFAIAWFFFPRLVLVAIDPATGQPHLLLPQDMRPAKPPIDASPGGNR